jgi:spore maturation protein SpmB
MLMNISANLLGLDNASTPLGLKAMAHLQELNPEKDKASDAQIMFLVLNTSGLTIIPLSIMVFRSQLGALQPSDVFVPILLTTSVSTLAGMSAVALRQGISFRDRVLFSWMFLMLCGLGLVIMVFASLPKDQVSVLSSLLGNLLLFSIIALFVLAAIRKRIPVFDTFIEGAKEGFPVAVRIIPYLVAMLVGIGVFRSCGALDFILELIRRSVELTGFNSEFVNALPTAFMKPFSGSGARGMMVDAMNTYGPDSFVGKLACTFQGSTETTFYVLAVYFGSVGIRNTRYALSYGLFADFCGIIAAIFFAWLFFS